MKPDKTYYLRSGERCLPNAIPCIFLGKVKVPLCSEGALVKILPPFEMAYNTPTPMLILTPAMDSVQLFPLSHRVTPVHIYSSDTIHKIVGGFAADNCFGVDKGGVSEGLPPTPVDINSTTTDRKGNERP